MVHVCRADSGVHRAGRPGRCAGLRSRHPRWPDPRWHREPRRACRRGSAGRTDRVGGRARGCRGRAGGRGGGDVCRAGLHRPALPRRPRALRRRPGSARGEEPRGPGDHHDRRGPGWPESHVADRGRDRGLSKGWDRGQHRTDGRARDRSLRRDGRRLRTARHRGGNRADAGARPTGHDRGCVGARGRSGVPTRAVFDHGGADRPGRGRRRVRRLLLRAPAKPVSSSPLAHSEHRRRIHAAPDLAPRLAPDRDRRDARDDQDRSGDRDPRGRHAHQGQGPFQLGAVGGGRPRHRPRARRRRAGLSRPISVRDVRRWLGRSDSSVVLRTRRNRPQRRPRRPDVGTARSDGRLPGEPARAHAGTSRAARIAT